MSTAAPTSARRRTADEWLDAYVSAYYYAPSLALWRALEAQALGEQTINGPSLDIGGFDGSFAQAWLGDRPPMDVGLDLHPVPSSHLARAYRVMVRGDALRLPFADETFNFVLCNSVIEHLPDDRAALNEMGRVLRRGGHLILSTPSVYFHESLDTVRKARARGDDAAAGAYIKAIDKRLAHLRYRTLEEWTALLQRAGLRLEEHSYAVPPDAGAAWDRWERWGTRPIAGRHIHNYISSRKVGRVVPHGAWKRLFKRLLKDDYERAVREQQRPGAVGVTIVLKAVRA